MIPATGSDGGAVTGVLRRDPARDPAMRVERLSTVDRPSSRQWSGEAPQLSTVVCMGWRVEIWERPSGAAASQDAHLVMPDPSGHRLRVAVLDGVTPTERCRGVAGVDGAMYAAAIGSLALRRPERPLERCLVAANEHLYDPRLARSRDQQQTCVTAADIHPDGTIDVVRAGDCEAWARTDRGWVSLGTGSALTPESAAAWGAWQVGNVNAGRRLRHQAEERYLGRIEAWTSTAVGRFPRPVVQRFTARDALELVLASDGARLSESVLDDIPRWLAELRGWERRRADLAAASGKVHDDVTVLRLRPLRTAVESAPFRDEVLPRSSADPAAADRERRAA